MSLFGRQIVYPFSRFTFCVHAARLFGRLWKAFFFTFDRFAATAMSSITQRTSGLVQRRTEAIRSAAADKERESGAEEDEARRGEEEDDDKGDSKETRLTLMEEVLLLGLKDREVWAVFNLSNGLSRPKRCYPTLPKTMFTLASVTMLANVTKLCLAVFKL